MPATDTGDHGNGLAASDLYGTGVRIGIYLQALGMICACIRINAAGLKLASSALMLALLGSWSVLIARKDISPAEAWIILSIINILWVPASSALLCPTAVVGEGIGIFALMVAMLWYAVAMCLFWGSYYRTLPTLGTSNTAFFFTKVNMNYQFRTFTLVTSVFQLQATVGIIIFGMIIIQKGAEAWRQGKPGLELSNIAKTKEKSLSFVKMSELVVRFSSVLSIFIWVMSVVGAELMIKWNDLTPISDLSLPGQSIPLAIGIVILVDGIFGLCQKKREHKYPGLEGVKLSD